MESVGYNRFSSSDPEISHNQPHHEFQPHFSLPISEVNQQISDVMESLHYFQHSFKLPQAGLLISEPVAPVQGTCKEGWTFYKEKCYFVSVQMKDWESAENDCIRKNGHLLVVNNREEEDYISQLIRHDHNSHFWMGLVERETEGEWTWVDGTNFGKTEHFWDEGQPDNWDVRVNGEDCGQLHGYPKTPRRLWNDGDCTLPNKYICEAPVPKH
ncbi:asialoglycoprotein receptor-like 1 isoform X2 [Hoplias malabaricus]|uniref:asialoglycoprotein receptor-like 1 isoform X2 n=1 Tax=Hoplias malabaricus TaxID=27720 RepID=UPI0034633E91